MSLMLKPVGIFRCARCDRYEVARQGVLMPESQGVVHIYPPFEAALDGLDGFDRIWLIFVFHRNQPSSKLKVVPPRHRDKVGLFATRAPGRPNSVGMSCVRLLGVERGCLSVSQVDLLDETPILDIKPYLPYCDAFPNASSGWVPEPDCYHVSFSEDATARIEWVQARTGYKLESYARVQLQEHPLDHRRKRIRCLHHENDEAHGELSFRHWRLRYRVMNRHVVVYGVSSEIPTDGVSDQHHLDFQLAFGT